ncbi:SRPBCC family protein [Rufibacter sp. H-1]|uniref:SRPBCC family protein n=1 Tax=Rufibacter sediminis TaxID=2762756 RepID=A0ABR6VQ06_9BACT|nr:SRPBCC family protein [Rufibacter sediminis]
MTLALTAFSCGLAFAQSNGEFPQTKVTATINAPLDSAFNYIVPVDLAHIFKRYGRLPAIVRTDEKEKWIRAGMSRTVFFEDGSTSKESLLTVVPHTSFSYRIESFTSQLRFLAERIEGDWVFTDLGDGQVKVEWTYRVVPKNSITRGIIKLLLLEDINGLLRNALATLKDDLESGRYKNASR